MEEHEEGVVKLNTSYSVNGGESGQTLFTHSIGSVISCFLPAYGGGGGGGGEILHTQTMGGSIFHLLPIKEIL